MSASVWGDFVRRVLVESRREQVREAKSMAVWNASFRAAELRVREDGACDEFFTHTKHWAFMVKGVPPMHIDPLETRRILTQQLYELHRTRWDSFQRSKRASDTQ